MELGEVFGDGLPTILAGKVPDVVYFGVDPVLTQDAFHLHHVLALRVIIGLPACWQAVELVDAKQLAYKWDNALDPFVNRIENILLSFPLSLLGARSIKGLTDSLIVK